MNGIKKWFGSVHVIRDVDLSIEQGEFVVFVGPSGCGKSTLLRIIAGLEETSSGSVWIEGKDVTHVAASKRGLAMVFQSYALYPHMTVKENLAFSLKLSHIGKGEITKRVAEAAKTLHLEEFLDRRPKQLSGGQRQRVAIGRAIVRSPKVFLFDEPLSNLDAELRVRMRLEIAKLHKQLGATMVYVTHDQVEAMTLADRIVVMRAGRIEQLGTPSQLYSDPENIFVARFIGSPKMNMIKAKVVSRDEGRIELNSNSCDLGRISMEVKDPAIEPGVEVLLGIRPEHFEPNGPASMTILVEVIEDLGGVLFAYSGIDGDEPLIVRVDPKDRVHEDAEIRMGFDPADALLFDPVSEARIR